MKLAPFSSRYNGISTLQSCNRLSKEQLVKSVQGTVVQVEPRYEIKNTQSRTTL